MGRRPTVSLLGSFEPKRARPVPLSKSVASWCELPAATIARVIGRGEQRIWIRQVTVELLTIVGALVLAVIPISAPWIEFWYSTTVYPRIQRTLTPFSNLVPFAILDLLLLIVVPTVIFRLVAAGRESWRVRGVRPLGRTVFHLLATTAALYIAFLALWGFNYRRVRMENRLVLDRAAPNSERVVELGLKAVSEMNRLYSTAHEQLVVGSEWRDESLRSAFADIQHALASGPQAEPGRLKRSMLGSYFRWAGVDGMVNPFGLEVIANPDLLAFERPFVAAHEWSHLAGYADEAEANFVGWLTCVRGSPSHQYSGWFFLYWQIAGEVNAQERGRLNMALADGPRRDVNAVITRLRRGQIPALQRASWQVYDKYLKANRVEAGVRSYGEVVTLVLRARFAPEWMPVRRGGE
jgi:Protein of unknown function (DUF3810)